MKNTAKKFLSLLIAAMMIFGAAVAGAGSFDFVDIGIKAEAAEEYYKEGYYNYKIENGSATITGVDKSINGDVIVPSTLGGYSVANISAYAFCDCYNLTGVTITNGINNIGDCAFADCHSLKSITIPDSVTNIGELAFIRCTSLTNITIPDSVISIGERAFYECTGLSSIIVDPENTTYLNDESGVLFNRDKTVLIQYPIGNIRTNYSIPNTVTTIGFSAFEGNSSLTNITIPNSVISIGNSAFDSCVSLVSITIPDSVTSIISGAFRGCSNLISIDIPNSVTNIDASAFYNTGYHNNAANWENKVLYIGNHLIDTEYDISELYEIKSGTKTVAGAAFQHRIRLTGIKIPDSMVTIGYRSFEGCDYLTDVYYSGTEENWNKITIDEYNECLLNATMNFVENLYCVTWIVDGAKTTQEYEAGAKITPPANPTKSGYTFKGWNPSVPETMPEKDMTFTAVFEKNVYTATWIVDGAKTTQKYELGAKITAPANPSKSGYVFKGWSPAVPAAMPANDMTFTAVFEKAPEKNIYNLGEETYNFQNPNIYTDYYRCDYGAGGHCFGMSATSSGYYMGELDITSAGGKKGQDLYDLTLTPDVQYPICYYQAIQGEFSKNATVAGGSWYLNNHKYNTNSDWNEVVNYVKNHAYDGKGTLQIGVRNNEGGHAVNFLRYEEVNGQARIYAYDNNFPAIETYFYMDSSGYIQQAPKSAFDEGLRCIALRSMTQYFELAGNYDSTRYIYAEKDTIAIKGATAYIMDGTENGVEYVMYGVPANAIEVTVTPLVNYAEFTYVEESYSFGALTDDTFGTFKLASSNEDDSFESEPSLTIHNAGTDASISIKSPSTATISYGDSIILHAEVENLPKGGKIVWESDNSCFALSASADGTTCTISPAENGSSTITATVVDADGNEVDSDSQTMTAKAGFFQKIIAFFKSLFGLTKVIPEAIKF